MSTLFTTGLFSAIGKVFSGDPVIESPPSATPTSTPYKHSALYNQRRTLDVRDQEQTRANQVYQEWADPSKTRILAGPPAPLLNKVDYADSRLPIQYRDRAYSVHTSQSPPTAFDQSATSTPHGQPSSSIGRYASNGAVTSGGVAGISLTGEPIDPHTFRHNNMVPYFGSAVRQSVDEYANEALMEKFNGTSATYREKQEVNTMFRPEKNMGNPYGTSNLDGYQRDRYIAGRYHNGITPIEKIYVGPGLNNGYTAEPTGGFQQADTITYALPKTVDDLRTLNNPKVSYYGRIIAGKHIGRTGKVGLLQKHAPDRDFEMSPARYFTTTGAVTGATQRPTMIVKNTARKETTKRTYLGPAGPENSVSKHNPYRSRYRTPHRVVLAALALGGADSLQGQWKESMPMADYGKSTYRNDPNARTCTEASAANYVGVADGTGTNFRPASRPGSRLRKTRKAYLIGNPRQAGNVAPATIHRGGGDVRSDDVARTTIKETTLYEHLGNKGIVSDAKGVVWDPSQTARTTVKETTANILYMGNMAGKDGKYENAAYMKRKMRAVKTRREKSRSFLGAAQVGVGGGAHATTKYQAVTTNRALLAKYQYMGVADGSASAGGQARVREDIDNSIVKVQRVSKEHTPGAAGPSETPNAKKVHATTRRLAEQQSQFISERGAAPTKVYNSLPQANQHAETHSRQTLDNTHLADRLDPVMVQQFKDNPYTQPLDSYWN